MSMDKERDDVVASHGGDDHNETKSKLVTFKGGASPQRAPSAAETLPLSRPNAMSDNQLNNEHPLSPATGKPDNGTPEEMTISNTRKRNAFSELMASKPKQQKMVPTTNNVAKPSLPRPTFASGLLNYITNPDTFPPGAIISQTEHTILIKDLYPKALVHLLLLPKNPHLYNLTPFEAFQPTDPSHTAFINLIRTEAKTAALLAASELSRLVSPHSKSCQARNDALNSDDPPFTLPPARDFLPDIKIGVHATPSMDTLHVHIISVDNYSPCLKTKKHYNSFNSNFFVGLDEFPLSEEHVSLTKEGQESLIKGDMKCWRCGRDFGNKFKQLKEHLEEEYEEWRKV